MQGNYGAKLLKAERNLPSLRNSHILDEGACRHLKRQSRNTKTYYTQGAYNHNTSKTSEQDTLRVQGSVDSYESKQSDFESNIHHKMRLKDSKMLNNGFKMYPTNKKQFKVLEPQMQFRVKSLTAHQQKQLEEHKAQKEAIARYERYMKKKEDYAKNKEQRRKEKSEEKQKKIEERDRR